MRDWREFFPLHTPRKEQVEALDAICKHYIDGKRFVVVQAPTGTGKSAIAVCVSRWMAANFPVGEDEAYGGVILTSQKTLQDQYTGDFSAIAADLRSSSNYPCAWADGITCGETLRITKTTGGWPCKTEPSCQKGLDCPYKGAKTRFIGSTVGITNYSYLLSEATYAHSLKVRQLLVCDEAHGIEESIRKFVTVSVDESLSRELKLVLPDRESNDDDVLKWMDEKYLPTIKKAVATLEKVILTHHGKRKKIPAQLRSLARQHEFLDKKMCQANRWKSDAAELRTEYVLIRNEGSVNQERSIELKPLNVSAAANDVLYSRGTRVLMMSATILDFDTFARSSGIPKSQSAFVDVKSSFDPSHFGIVYRPVALMNKGSIEISIPKIVDQVREILKAHPNEKGILHASNYSVCRAFKSLNDPRLLIQDTGADRERILEHHINSPDPTVIVSPSMMEGLDLKDDFGRFQVICKVPFPSLGDPVIKRLMEANRNWYSWRTVLTLVQAVGRCVRNEDDWAKTYILDECFTSLFSRNTRMFTSTFSEMTVENIDKKRKK